MKRPSSKSAQWFRQQRKIARDAGANVGQRRRRPDAPSALHHRLDQRLARLFVRLNGDYVTGHPAVGTVLTPDLFAPRPSRLA